MLYERLRWKNVLICIRQTSIVLTHPGCLSLRKSLITSTDLTLRFWLLMTGPPLSLLPRGLASLSRGFDLFILFTTWRINCSGGLYSYSWEQTDCFQRFPDCGWSLRIMGGKFWIFMNVFSRNGLFKLTVAISFIHNSTIRYDNLVSIFLSVIKNCDEFAWGIILKH